MINKKINLYLAKSFLKNFLLTILGFFVMFFLISLIDVFERVKNDNVGFLVIFGLSIFKTPELISSVAIPAILISSIITFYQLSTKNEITIIRNCGYSIWKISLPFQITAFILGLFWISCFSFLEIWSEENFDKLEKKYIKAEMRESLDIDSGVWFRQENLSLKNESIIFVIRKIYKNSDSFSNVSLWFFDVNQGFYKRIDADSMYLDDKRWIIKNAIINDDDNINKNLDEITIPTDFNIDFVRNKIINNFERVQLFSIFELPKIIKELDLSGLNSKKFKVYFNSQMSLPLIFLIMILFATYFGICESRSGRANLKIFLGTAMGLVVFLISSISTKLGSSGIISVFESTWLIMIIYFSIGILLLYRKENLGS